MEKQNSKIKDKAIIDKPISIVCIILVAIFVFFMCLKTRGDPQCSKRGI